MQLTGLDIETTGLDRTKGHRLIQVGLSFSVYNQIVSYVQPEGDIVFDPEAMAVNDISLNVIRLAPIQTRVDTQIASQLHQAGFGPGSLQAVGWNVGGFDLNFVRQELPLVSEFFSHRVLDLTGVCIIKAGNDDWRALKKRWHDLVEQILGKGEWHDAGFDAAAALLTARLLLNKML